MNRLIPASAFAACSFMALLFSCNSVDNDPPGGAASDSAALVNRGAYLVTIGGCNDCHSPKRMGKMGPEVIPETQLSGYPSSRPLAAFDTALAKKGIAQFNEDMTAAAGPWGISFALNITSDVSGIGNWTPENFKTAMRHGKLKGAEKGRTLLPPMPWTNYTQMTDEDLNAIFSYLKQTNPVKNFPPVPQYF
ncbi:c-type cytochrome [Chitinophaga rhizosphaerae]|uniref:c-type cytochrome n=1 Tax=Chitinophaga rhizosphaerae TaxID=1864947 RepID=UPI000F80F4B9|nr:c-type cytochrome [Chitinophaga rhizosphaerae]